MPIAAQSDALPNERKIEIVRMLDAPRSLVFRLWTEPKHLAQWWGPKMFTNPVCEVDARVGGRMYIVMRAPDGTDYPMSGTFSELTPPERLAFKAIAEDKDGTPLLEAHTVVTFEEAGQGKTRLTVRAHGVGIAPVAAQMLAGMQEGWSQSLDKLAELAAAQ